MADILNELVSRLSLDADDFTKGIDKATGSTDSFGKFMDGMAARLLSPAGAIGALTAIGAASFQAAIMYDEASDTIAAKTGQTGAALVALEKSFDTVFKNVPSNSIAVAEAISSLSNRLQVTGAPLEALSVQFLNLARVHKEELAPLIDATANAFMRWGVVTEDQSEMLDYFYNVAAKANTTVTALSVQIAAVSASFSAAGLDIRQTAELLGTLALGGVEVEKVMPGVKKAIMEMAKAGVDPSAGFPALVAQIKNAKTETEALAIGARAFGVRGGAELVNAIRMGRLEAGEFSEAMSGAKQSINDLAKATDDFQEEWERSWHNIQSGLKGFGSWLMENLKADIIHLNKFFDAFNKGIEQNIQWLDKLAKKVGLDSWVTTTAEAAKAAQAFADGAAKIKPPVDAASDAVRSASDAFETAAEKTARLRNEQKKLEEENDALSASMAAQVSNLVYQQGVQEKNAEATIKAYEAIREMRVALEDLDATVLEATPNLEGYAEGMKIIAGIKLEQIAPPFLIDDDLIAKGKKLGPDIAKGADQATSAWKEFGKEVSTIMTNLAQSIGKNVINLVLGIDRRKFNADLDQQTADLQKSLAERSAEYEKYQIDIAAQIDAARADNAAGLAEELADLQASLDDRTAEWLRYQDDAALTEARLREDMAAELADSLRDLQDNLEDKQRSYDEYARDTADRAGELRSKFAEALQDELSDLQANLDKRREAYEDFVADTQVTQARNEEDLAEKLDDERRDVDRNITAKTTSYNRETEELRRRIAAEKALGAKANKDRIKEWEIELAEKEADYQTYVRQQNEDYAEYVSDQQRSYARETADLKLELGRRTEEWEDYQVEIALKRDDAISDNQRELAAELADLQESLDDKRKELDVYRTDVAAKSAELRADYQTDLARELMDLKTALARKAGEYQAYRDEVVAKMGGLPEAYAADLAKELDDLNASLADKRTAYDAFAADVELKLADLVEKHRTAWSDVKTFFGQTLTDMGGALTAWISEYLVGKLFSKLGELITDIFPSLGKAISGALGGGADAAGSVAGGASSAAGGGLTGAVGGLMGAVTMLSSAVSAIADVISVVVLERIHTDTSRIEEHLRYLRSGLMDELVKGAGSIFDNLAVAIPVIPLIWAGLQRIEQETFKLFDITDLLTTIRDEMRLSIYPQMALLAAGSAGALSVPAGGSALLWESRESYAPRAITIPITVTLDGKVVAESVVNYLEGTGTRVP